MSLWNRPTLAKSLSLFRLGLGLAEIAMPRRMARTVGAAAGDGNGPRDALIATGIRGVATSVASLIRPGAVAPVWARLAGDALDVGLLAWFSRSKVRRTDRLVIAAAAVLGTAALDALAARRAARQGEAGTPEVSAEPPPADAKPA